MSTWKFPLGKHKHWHISKNCWIVLKDLPFAIAYFDDIIIHSKTTKEHLDHLQVFHKLCDAELTMKLRKCHFFAMEI